MNPNWNHRRNESRARSPSPAPNNSFVSSRPVLPPISASLSDTRYSSGMSTLHPPPRPGSTVYDPLSSQSSSMYSDVGSRYQSWGPSSASQASRYPGNYDSFIPPGLPGQYNVQEPRYPPLSSSNAPPSMLHRQQRQSVVRPSIERRHVYEGQTQIEMGPNPTLYIPDTQPPPPLFPPQRSSNLGYDYSPPSLSPADRQLPPPFPPEPMQSGGHFYPTVPSVSTGGDWGSMQGQMHSPISPQSYGRPGEFPPYMEPQQEPVIKKKRKRADARQLSILNEVYARTAFPSTEERRSLALQLEMTPRSVQIWFQNKRQANRQNRPVTTAPTPAPPILPPPPLQSIDAYPRPTSRLSPLSKVPSPSNTSYSAGSEYSGSHIYPSQPVASYSSGSPLGQLRDRDPRSRSLSQEREREFRPPPPLPRRR